MDPKQCEDHQQMTAGFQALEGYHPMVTWIGLGP